MPEVPRSLEQRKADVLTRLGSPVADAWVSTAGGDEPYLVPLTLGWFRERLLLATSRTSPTARNLEANGRARVGFGPTRDVVVIDAVLEATLPVAEAHDEGAAYADQNDWDPRTAGEAYVFLVLRPERIQAWRELDEIPGRVVMRSGAWVV
ncbi:pyridoxamine 5'-phosphate oxidase family protein [Paractinoplanes lichenicola]|uniref:Pyridoxamine 5'-phosphate oxidase family protein n=1 Tax=Paractinoplanes lichenicola TaxID=2802976 RepID=A0ABS1VPG4_9ACTN|nr:pyridoxamine 5'-phosphate oxidase family protein [Actinoplanes lichenicola]MBL7256612.1 pyridoxamine 5'-phosphate oxidase family protein [Actinoplanes lichenicola]